MSNPFGMLSPDEIRRALLMGAIVAQVKETRRHVEAQIESGVLGGRPGPRLDGRLAGPVEDGSGTTVDGLMTAEEALDSEPITSCEKAEWLAGESAGSSWPAPVAGQDRQPHDERPSSIGGRRVRRSRPTVGSCRCSASPTRRPWFKSIAPARSNRQSTLDEGSFRGSQSRPNPRALGLGRGRSMWPSITGQSRREAE